MCPVYSHIPKDVKILPRKLGPDYIFDLDFARNHLNSVIFAYVTSGYQLLNYAQEFIGPLLQVDDVLNSKKAQDEFTVVC